MHSISVIKVPCTAEWQARSSQGVFHWL